MSLLCLPFTTLFHGSIFQDARIKSSDDYEKNQSEKGSLLCTANDMLKENRNKSLDIIKVVANSILSADKMTLIRLYHSLV